MDLDLKHSFSSLRGAVTVLKCFPLYVSFHEINLLSGKKISIILSYVLYPRCKTITNKRKTEVNT